MKNLYEVEVKYTDGTKEILRLQAERIKEAEAMAADWVDMRKVVEEISVKGEEIKRKGSKV